MRNDYEKFLGDTVHPQDLKLPMARQFASALADKSIDYAKLVEARALNGTENVLFEVTVECPQICAHPILTYEPIAVSFTGEQSATPIAFSVRSDFPRNVPHLNLFQKNCPASFCLYDEPFRDLKWRWTPARFVARIRGWLSRTARGELHQPDQPLEPILLDSDGILIIPADIFREGGSKKPLLIILSKDAPPADQNDKTLPFLFQCTPQTHGVIKYRPNTLAELAILLEGDADRFLEEFRAWLKVMYNRGTEHLNAAVVILVILPKRRVQDSPVETTEYFAFRPKDSSQDGHVNSASVTQIGASLDVFDLRAGKVPGLTLQADQSKKGEDLGLLILNPIWGMKQETLAILNGQTAPPAGTLCAIGVGALGSQVILNLARSGYGRWTLIDDDLILPHNLARHLSPGDFVGKQKAEIVAFMANSLTDGERPFSAITENVLSPMELSSELVRAIHGSPFVLDMSASATVARRLAANDQVKGRCCSMFLSPTGADLVLMAEDDKRSLRLDQLEMQYYRACVGESGLKDHLGSPENRMRYGQSCRDLTGRIPQHLVALHAAIAARAIPEVISNPKPLITVWRSKADGSVSCIEVSHSNAIRMPTGEWNVVTDEALVDKLLRLRSEKLPKETGGVLLGSLDLERRIVHIVETIPSPPDSEEWPTLYIRGIKGLRAKVDEISKKTDGMLEYIGEWHSHPDGIATAPSGDDIRVFGWITEIMDAEGLPAVMMIVGDNGSMSCYVAHIVKGESLLPSPVEQ